MLKALAIVLNQKLEYPATCYHAPGKDGETRGAKAAVRSVCAHLPKNRFVFRSDVKSYYASIDHGILLSLVRDRVDCPIVMDLIGQYVRRTVHLRRVEAGGNYQTVNQTVTRGIGLGCPLSPVMAAIYLELLDRRMEATGLTYARFMDDWVVLAPTRWALRRAIVVINETLRELPCCRWRPLLWVCALPDLGLL